MKISIPHKETQLGAVTHVKKMLNESRAQMAAHVSDVEEEWKNNVLHFAFTAQRQHFKGTLEVKDRSFDLDVKLPLMMRMFEGRIKRMVEDETKKMLG